MRALLVATALVVAALAGCAAPVEAPTNATAVVAAPADGLLASPEGLAPARFADVDPVDRTLWLNGTFKLQDASRPPQVPGLLPAPATAIAQLDLTSDVPVGIPSTLFARVDMPLAQGDFDLWFEVSSEEWRTGGGCQPRGGFSEAARGLVHQADPVRMSLFYDEAEPAAEVPYSVLVRVQADPTVAPGGMSVALEVPAGTSSIVVEPVGEPRDGCMFDLETPNLMLWAPDDAFLGHRELPEGRTTVELPHAEGGEYVLLLSQGGRGLRVHAPPGSTLRALAQEFGQSEPHAGGPDGVEWTFEQPRVPTLAGMTFDSPAVAKDVTFSYASPGTTFFEGTFEGEWVTANAAQIQSGFWFDSAFGVPGLEAGTYTGRVKFGQGAGPDAVQVRDVFAYWVR